MNRNTAPSVAWANMRIKRTDPDANIIITPSDHMVMNEDSFAHSLEIGLSYVTENDVLGWRFWMRFLGHAYQYNRTLIPNMKIRLEDAMVGLPKETHMTCTQFVLWLKEHVPEAATSCSEAALPLAVSNGLRTLQNEGKIEIIATKDAIRTGLFPLRGVDKNDFSDIVIKEIS